ncbi:MAG: phage tail protein, partial [Clostridium sp.]|nr:phage tail protein [Clostridium sp.]
MLINGLDISIYGGIQLQTDIQNSKQYSNYELLLNCSKPILLGKEEKLKSIKVEILFKGDSRDQILDNISNLISKLDGIIDLKLEGYSKTYKVILVDDVIQKKKSKRKYKILLEFVGYSVMDEITETINRTTSKTINVVGNSETPAIVEITPSIDL